MFKLQWTVVLVVAFYIVVAGCDSESTQQSDVRNQTYDSTFSANETHATGDLPTLIDIPRSVSGFQSVNGKNFIAAAGTRIEKQAVVLSLQQDDLSENNPQDGDNPESHHLAYVIYRFGPITDPIAGLKIVSSSHYESPVWIGLADYDENHWEFPFPSEFGSTEIWNTQSEISFDNYLTEEQYFTMAIILADDKEEITIYSLELVLVTEVDELTTSHNKDYGIELSWDPPSRSEGTFISRREQTEPPSSWITITTDPLAPEINCYCDYTTNPGSVYEYSVSSGYGPSQYPNDLQWSSGVIASGRRLVAYTDLPISEGSSVYATPVNWYNNLGFIGFIPNTHKLLAFQLTSFPPSQDWYQHTAADGLVQSNLSWQPGLPYPVSIYQHLSDNNPYLTICYSGSDGVYSQVTGIDEMGQVTWENPVLIREGPLQAIQTFKMSRRIGLLTLNTITNKLEISDSMDMYGRHWFDFDEWSWPWRHLDSGIPNGKITSIYGNVGEMLCFTEQLTNQLKVFTLIDNDWKDQSPGITASINPNITELIVPPLSPGLGIVYITEDKKELNLLSRELHNPWDIDHQINIHSSTSEFGITDIDIYCPAGYAMGNYIAYIEDGNIYVSSCYNWSLANWSLPRLIDDSGDCEQIEFIRIGSDEEYHYGTYLTYFTTNEKGNVRFNFKAIDSRFIPEP